MDYSQTLAYLYASQPAFHLIGAAAYKPGFDNILQLMSHLGNPHQKLRCIHVAGTNGKGSTSHLLAATLLRAGLKVGLYTSPHLIDFRERIRVFTPFKDAPSDVITQSTMIPEEQVVQFVRDHQAVLELIQPSFFETTFAMAANYFVEQQVDIAVIEVGLGGALDATNIITPILSVITNIGIDHTEFLGSTLASIAQQKAGIIKPHVPCVIGEANDETWDVFVRQAQACDIWGEGLETSTCRIWRADWCNFLKKRRRLRVPTCQLTGAYQEHNMQTAYVALQALRYADPTLPLMRDQYIADAYAHVIDWTGLMGRWQVIEQEPMVICDTGHNSHGLKYVMQQLRDLQTSTNTLRIVLGMVQDKDIDQVLPLLPKDAVYYFTQANTSRAIPAEQLLKKYQKHIGEEVAIHASAYATVPLALQQAKRDAQPQDIIFIGGSNYIVGEALHHIR
ncbi:MAG: bifunctional folylpolyglutamate synthase/dihydrofolate synthase [Paludibacteraceae bacterium]|nr:bifunctional folylpolyglutamate synthase/dihydrofolate synthase [Paludibacteraceae bacterium]